MKESHNTVIQDKEKRMARICWNTEGWEQPSGAAFKSRNKKAFENSAGFGCEEWLLDTQKLIEGYHYSFLQAIHSNWDTYEGKLLDLFLFTINGKTKERWWLGEIKNVQVITREEAREVQEFYNKKGWLAAMEAQVIGVGGDLKKLYSFTNNHSFFNLKYHPRDLNLLEHPTKIQKTDKTIKATYNSTLYNYTTPPSLEIEPPTDFVFTSGHTVRKEKKLFVRKESKKQIALFHGEIQNKIYQQLVQKYGEGNVSTENHTGHNTSIDIVVKDQEEFIFYELKGYKSIKKCIREALSQLMEYAYFPNASRASKLIIVSQNSIDPDTILYLKKLRTSFNLPIYYQQYNTVTQQLEEILY